MQLGFDASVPHGFAVVSTSRNVDAPERRCNSVSPSRCGWRVRRAEFDTKQASLRPSSSC
eukprot:10387450-Lingulodinium_polyedra.AAC.1